MVDELNTFSNFLGLKPNKIKCEIGGIDILNGKWHYVVCEMAVNNETVKILGVYFWNNKNLEPYQTFCEHIVKIESF